MSVVVVPPTIQLSARKPLLTVCVDLFCSLLSNTEQKGYILSPVALLGVAFHVFSLFFPKFSLFTTLIGSSTMDDMIPR